MIRPALCLLLVAAAARADDLRAAYTYAKRLPEDRRKAYAAEHAPRYAGTAKAEDQLYLGYLWSWAEEWKRAASSFDAYVRGATAAHPRNRATAMVERARALMELRAWNEVPDEVTRFRTEFPGDRHLGSMLFYLGRARRADGRLEQALEAFREGAAAGSDLAAHEVVDALVQLGRYGEARQAAAALPESARAATLLAALERLGEPVEIRIGHWTGAPRPESIRGTPMLLSFWTMRAGKAKDDVHAYTNAWAEAFRGKVNVVGAGLYEHFDPVTMRTVDEMPPHEEHGFVDAWHREYALRYPLVLLEDAALHKACGVDPERPVLPCVAAVDGEGRLRYVRVVGGPWAAEAVDSMLRRLLSE